MSLTNCKPAEIAPDSVPGNGTVRISVTSENTRTENDGMHTIWADDDALNAFCAIPNSTYTNLGKASIEDGAGTGRAVFALTGASVPAGTVDWYILYPYNAANTTPAKLQVTIGGESVTQDGYGSTAHLAGSTCPLFGIVKGAAAEDITIPVQQLSSVIAFNVSNNAGVSMKVKSVKLRATEEIVGGFVVDLLADAPAFTASVASSESVVSVSGAASLSDGATARVYMPVKPYKHDTSSKLAVTVTLDVDGSTVSVPFELTVSPASATFSAGYIKPVALKVTSGMLFGSMNVTSVESKCHKADVKGEAAAVGTSEIQWRKSGSGSWQAASSSVSGGTVSATITGLDDNTSYEVRVSAGSAYGPAYTFTTKKEGAQLYNMGFDEWTITSNVHYCYGSGASAEQKKIWASANKTTYQYASVNGAAKETSKLAVSGSGKNALKLTSKKDVGVLFWKKFAAGSLFTGTMGDINVSTQTATINMGVTFTDRPDALEGYAMYQPKAIDAYDSDHKSLKGKTDNGHVFVLLTDWSGPFAVTPPNTLIDFDGDSHIIGYGKIVFDSNMTAYKKFRIDIDYRSNRTPKYVVICGASSALGDYFTGADGSVLYLDEFKFVYE